MFLRGNLSHSVLAPLLHDVFGVLQHLLLPQVKEVGGIGVKLQGLLPIVPANKHLQTEIRISCFMLCKQTFYFLLMILFVINA